MRVLAFAAATTVLLLLGGCAEDKGSATTAAATPAPSTDDAAAFLKWSMDRHQQLRSFQANVAWSAQMGPQEEKNVSTRTISYEAPNKFKVEASREVRGNKLVQTSVSDGKTLLEYTNQANLQGLEYEAPSSLAETTSMQMQHPMFCGSLLYPMFGGSANYGKLVQEQKPVAFAGEESISGETAKKVKFYGTGMYGNVEMLIGSKTGLVHRISYDSEGLINELKKMKAPAAELERIKNLKSTSEERYTGFKVDADLEDELFATNKPEGINFVQGGGSSAPKPVVAAGQPAPAFTVKTLESGDKVSLASLKGKVVLVDFWATWCGPCVKGLPDTANLHKELSSKGLAVLAVSNEDKAKIQGFMTDKKISLPTFIDEKGVMGDTYKVNAIPTMVIIDREGRMVDQFVGLQPIETIKSSLKKAGLEI